MSINLMIYLTHYVEQCADNQAEDHQKAKFSAQSVFPFRHIPQNAKLLTQEALPKLKIKFIKEMPYLNHTYKREYIHADYRRKTLVPIEFS